LLPAQAFVSCAKGQFSRYSFLLRRFSARKAHRPVQAEISPPALILFLFLLGDFGSQLVRVSVGPVSCPRLDLATVQSTGWFRSGSFRFTLTCIFQLCVLMPLKAS
jgi:hypothetical protein